MLNIKEIALKVGLQAFEEHPYDKGHVVSPSGYTWIDDKLIEFAEAIISAYKAELLKGVGEPVAARRKVAMWQGGDDYKYEWVVVKEHTPGTEPLYTSDQVAAAVAKATKPIDGVAKPAGYFQVEFYGGNPMHQQVGSQYQAELGVFPLYTAEAVTVAVNQFKEQLAKAEQRVAELEAEVERLSAAHVKACQANADSQAELAAEQLNNKLLREALDDTFSFLERHSNRWDGINGKHPQAVAEAAREALSIPASTEALDKYVAEKVKDSESRTGNQSPCYTIARDMAVRMWEKHYKTDAPNWEPLDDFMGVLSQISNMLTGLGNVEKITKQRDLAVEALEWALSNINCEPFEWSDEENADAHTAAIEALSAIKESEAK